MGLLVGGGKYELEMTVANVKRNSPTVIINKSGMVANILAYAYQQTYSLVPAGHVGSRSATEDTSPNRFKFS